MLPLVLDLLILILILIAIYGIGYSIQWFLPFSYWSRSAHIAFTMGFGVAAISTLWFVLGLLGLLLPVAAWLVLLLGVGLALWQRRHLQDDALLIYRRLLTLWRSPSWFLRLVALGGLLTILLNLIADLAPVTEGDSVHQYLLLVRYWVEAGRYVQPTHIWAASLPGNILMFSAWGMLLREGTAIAGLISGFGMSLLFALAVYALARRFYSWQIAILASIFVLSMPDAAYLAQSAKVDMGWAFFEVLSLAAFLNWIAFKNPQDAGSRAQWLILSGLMLGFAAGSKNQTYISVALLGLWLIIHHMRNRDWTALWQNALRFAFAVIIAAAPYYLYNLVVHHNPFYPVFADLFTDFFGATASPRSELGTEVFYPWTPGGYLSTLWHSSVGHTRPGWYLGTIIGPLFLMAIPIGLISGILQKDRPAQRMLGYAFAFSLVWFFIKQAARHLLPGLVLLAVVSALIYWQLQTRKPRWLRQSVSLLALLAMALNIANIGAVLYWSGSYRVALGLESRDAFLVRFHDQVMDHRYYPDWEAVETLNTLLRPSDRVITLHVSSTLYIVPDVVSGNWGDRIAYESITDEDTLLSTLHAAGIDYILVYKHTWITQPPLFTEGAFLNTYAHPIYEGNATILYELDQ